MFEFISEDEDTEARSGHLVLKHGTLETPAFLPVATKASVKMTTPRELEEMNAQGVIANAFVLFLRPGVDIIEAAGGIHRFMNWDRVVFTDSGGFQMLNPDFLVKVTDDHVTFKSPYDGQKHDITPEKCAEIQNQLGSDVALALDDCPAYGSDIDYVSASMKRTIHWARRFKKATEGKSQNSFGIIQGGTFKELREQCTRKLVEMDFDGYAIGGLCIGEPKELMHDVIGWTTPLIPKEKPRYLMGVGSPEDMLKAISMGVDIFDSVFPTTIHHKSKYEAEKTIQNHLSKFLILRTGWLFGGDKEHAKNFVYKRFLEAVNSDTIYADNSQIGNPTYTADFVEQIKVLIDNKQYGLFNCVNEAANISRYDYVKKIVEFFDLKCSVKVAPEGMFARVAPVSHNESAVNCKLNLLGLNVMNDWERSLDIYVQQMKSEI